MKIESVGNHVAWFGFILLFPGFVVYNYGISTGWWSQVFGGFFGYSVMVTVVASICCEILHGKNDVKKTSGFAVTIYIFLLYVVLWSGWNLIAIRDEPFFSILMVESVGTVFIWIAGLIVSVRLTSNAKILKLVSLLSFGSVLITFSHAFLIGGVSGPYLAFSMDIDDISSTYQGVGRSLLGVSLLASVAFYRRKTLSLIFSISLTFLLLLLGSRAHFFVGYLSLFLHILMQHFNGKKSIVMYVSIGIAVVATVLGYSFFLESRASEILDLSASHSWLLRRASNERALAIIAERPIFGFFGYHAWDEVGYAHNVLSAWTNFGLVGFILFCFISIYSLYLACVGFVLNIGNPKDWYFAVQFNIVAVVLIISSEPVMTSIFPALAWGFTMRAVENRFTFDVER